MSATAPHHVTASANVGPDAGGQLYTVVLAAGSGAPATLSLKQGGSGGQVICALAAVAGGSAVAPFSGIAYSGQLYADLAGAGATATIER